MTLPAADTEALLFGLPDDESLEADCYLVPVDSCYEFVGRMRLLWRGFDGGQDVRRYIDEYFGALAQRSRVMPP